jgi:hypothetical protein
MILANISARLQISGKDVKKRPSLLKKFGYFRLNQGEGIFFRLVQKGLWRHFPGPNSKMATKKEIFIDKIWDYFLWPSFSKIQSGKYDQYSEKGVGNPEKNPLPPD